MKTKSTNYRGYRFPPEIISHGVWLYHRFCLTFRDVEKLLRFEGEYHGTGSKPSNFMRTQLYLMKWFQEYSKGRPVTQ